jgi:hypothetical protein
MMTWCGQALAGRGVLLPAAAYVNGASGSMQWTPHTKLFDSPGQSIASYLHGQRHCAQ